MPKVIKRDHNKPAGWRIKSWAEAAGVHPNTVANWINSGILDSAKIGGTRIIPVSPEDFIAEHRETKGRGQPAPVI